MSVKHPPGSSLNEWMEMVSKCRQIELSDAVQCNKYGIFPTCFYNAVSWLRKNLPDLAGKVSILDFTSHKQDVFQIAIGSENSLAELFTPT